MKLYSVREASKILGVNVNKVYDLIRKKHINIIKLGNMKISSIELIRFIESNTGKDLTDLENIKDFKP